MLATETVTEAEVPAVEDTVDGLAVIAKSATPGGVELLEPPPQPESMRTNKAGTMQKYGRFIFG